MKRLGNEGMDVSALLGAVMSTETGCKEAGFSAEGEDKLVVALRPTPERTILLCIGKAHKKPKTNTSVCSTIGHAPRGLGSMCGEVIQSSSEISTKLVPHIGIRRTLLWKFLPRMSK